MIEMRWKKADRYDHNAIIIKADYMVFDGELDQDYAVLQYREGSIPVRVENHIVIATAATEWQDVELIEE